MMRNHLRVVLFGLFILSGAVSAHALENEFTKNNPDGNKYEFARSYISALSYFHEINVRWEKNPPKKRFSGDESKMIRGNIEYLVLDNASLRIAKNYMVKYLDSPNSLIRKAADTVIVACDTDIALNNKSKDLWQGWISFKNKTKPTQVEEQDFTDAQRQIELQRKESDKNIIKASFLLTKVILSQDNADDKGKLLAITQKQRNKLLDQLDKYGKDVLDWGLKPGQSTLDASIAVIREILEDPFFIAQK